MRHAACVTMLAIVMSASGFCQTFIQLKNRQIDTSAGVPSDSRGKTAARSAIASGRVHLIVQFPGVPGEDEANMVAEAGGTVLGYVHENGLLISLDAAAPLDSLGLTWWGPLEPVDKISSLLPVDSSSGVLIEAHPDVDLADARALATGLGIALHDNPDLGRNQILGEATPDQVAALAAADIIAYIFPASDDLLAGTPSLACASALTANGTVGQYIAKVGEGWDGTGLGSAALTYSWAALTAQLDAASAKAEVVRAFAEWTKAVKITFAPGARTDAGKNINILWGKKSHGDPYPFDGPGGVLAHTFYPSPPNPEPLAGDMHLDDDEHWRIGADIDLFSVVLHEAGHALGLGHSDRPGAVMYPYYQRATALTAEDIGAIQSLYAAQDGSPVNPSPKPTPTPAPQPLALTVNTPPATTTADYMSIAGASSGGSGAVAIRWTSSRGYSGIAQGSASWSFLAPIATGTNTLTITATDAQNASVTKAVTITRNVPPTTPVQINLQITYPGPASAYSTSAASTPVRGTASHTAGISRVQWSNNRGGGGIANGTVNWSAGDIALASGLNVITITATATDNTTASKTLQITSTRGAQADTTAPSLTIASPATTSVTTTASTIVLQGSASDNAGVTSVNWFSSAGPAGNASGTTNWTTSPIPLYFGYNTIIVRAYDAAGNMGWRAVQVLRK